MKWLAKADHLVDDWVFTWEVEGDSAWEAEEAAIRDIRNGKVKHVDYGTVEVEPMEEDKQLICNKLLEVLELTRGLHDVLELKYDPEKETVTALFASGFSKTANVNMDGGVAMIQDILKRII